MGSLFSKARTAPGAWSMILNSLDAADAALLQGIVHGSAPVQRRSMAKAITLLESTRADHRARADALLNALLPHTGRSLRLGISGVPGVGKSTFIEAARR